MSTPRSTKSLALAFILGALLVGGVLGFTADRMFGHDEACASYYTRVEMRKRFAEKLGLSAEQRAQVEAILDRKRASLDSVMAPVKPQVQAVSDSTTKRIEAVLDASQREKFARMRADHDRRERDDRAAVRGGRE
ncbi:MAG: hypothetical protein HOQ11_02480 [Gemmatimonadaceae bacterium]|nr:hypothetical protein [Gemmatimonadaceae bacterium]NUQ92299.1 hypothetical protein [Gemmatimonadaceae bacterium]NUR19726.1 hypothetical protein [Gemmatimonadaceae bacterium]NUS96254.1 hypothetical protein [Gemmatimonadaceae bacterium]